MKRLIITEEERSRILGMHQNAIARQYLNEQGDPEWEMYVKTHLDGTKEGYFLTTYGTLSPEEAKAGKNDINLGILKRGNNGVEFRDNTQYFYQCTNNPAEPTLPAGTIYDSDFKPKPDIVAGLKKGGSNYTTLFAKGCKAALDIEKQNQQVAAAARLKKEAPNNPKLKELIDSKQIRQEGNRYIATCTPGQNLYLFNKDGKTKYPVMTCDIKTGGDKDITDKLVQQGYILPN